MDYLQKIANELTNIIEYIVNTDNVDKNVVLDGIKKIVLLQNEKRAAYYGKNFTFAQLKFENDKNNPSRFGYNSCTKIQNNNSIKLETTLGINLVAYNFEEIIKNGSNDQKMALILKLINTISHEFRHLDQNMSITYGYLLDADIIQMNKEKIVRNNGNYLYNENYAEFTTEIDARVTAYNEVEKIIELMKIPSYNREKMFKTFNIIYSGGLRGSLDEEQGKVKGSQFSDSKTDGLEQDREIFVSLRADEYVRKNPKVIQENAFLKHEYNEDGSKKTLLEVAKQYKRILVKLKSDGNYNNMLFYRKIYMRILGERLLTASDNDMEKFQKFFSDDDLKQLYGILKKYYIDELQNIGRVHFDKAHEQEKINLISKNKRLLQRVVQLEYGSVKKDKFVENGNARTDQFVINGVDIGYVAPKKSTLDEINIYRKMITKYEKTETESEFSKREKMENRNIRMVLNAVNIQRCPSGFMQELDIKGGTTKTQFNILMRALKAAELLTVEGGRNYLEEFMNVPFIHDTLEIMKKDKNLLQYLNKITSNNMQRYETVAEKYQKEANEFINKKVSEKQKTPEEIFEYYSRHSSNGKLYGTPGEIALWAISTMQDGFFVKEFAGSGLHIDSSKKNAIILRKDLEKFSYSVRNTKVHVNGKEYYGIDEVK